MMKKKTQDSSLQRTVFPLLMYYFHGLTPIDGNLQYEYARYAFGQSYDSIVRASEIQMTESDRYCLYQNL